MYNGLPYKNSFEEKNSFRKSDNYLSKDSRTITMIQFLKVAFQSAITYLYKAKNYQIFHVPYNSTNAQNIIIYIIYFVLT